VSWLVHRDRLAELERAAAGDLPALRTTFLSPFDSLFWAGQREDLLWGFHNMLEAYRKEINRVYGYYCLPILHRDRMVGRFDPRLERKTGTLRLKALYLEPDVEMDEELIDSIAAAMRDFLAFHQAQTLVIERSQPQAFGLALSAAL
jgi:uncharacterized protein